MSQNPETTDGIQQPVTVLVIDDHGLFRACLLYTSDAADE